MNTAFDRFNKEKLIDIHTMLGIRKGRMRSYGPCPVCKEETRGSSDPRLPIGVTPNGKGWHCHKCKASGNMVDFLSYHIAGDKYQNVDYDSQKRILNWLVDKGFGQKKFRQDKTKHISALTKTTKKQQEIKVDTTSDFRWHKDLPKQYKDNIMKPEYLDVLKYVLEGRKIMASVIDKADLGAMKDRQGNKWLVIPLKDEKGEIVNMRFRSIPPQKKTWRLCQGRPTPLYNSHNLTNDRNEFVIITEGELDVLALACFGYNKNVVSGTLGASNLKDEWLNILEPYQGFYLWYDNDKAGDDGAEKLASKLGKFRSFRVRSEEKDVSDCLSMGRDQEYITEILQSNITPYISSSLKRCDDYTQQIEHLVMNPHALMGKSTGIPKLDNLVGGIRPGLWVVSGDTGHGKTTFITWLLWEQARRGTNIMVTSFEQRPIGTVQKLLRCQLGGDFSSMSADVRKQGLEDLGQMPIHILDHYGELEPQKVIEALRFSVRRHDIEIALIDHLGFLVRAESKDQSERQQIEKVVRELATIAVQDGITIILICHPSNISVSQQRRVRITDLKGASAIRQDAHVGMIVHRNECSDENSIPTTTIYVDKVRSEFGQAGSNCTLAFDPLSCTYAETWEQTPSGSQSKTIVMPQR